MNRNQRDEYDLLIIAHFGFNAEISNGDEQVKADAIRIGRYANGEFPTESREFAKRIFYTVFMGSENRWVHASGPLHAIVVKSSYTSIRNLGLN